jgi:Holliday junction resolvasome RuvABC ATP-dependent DNA helicase subunit
VLQNFNIVKDGYTVKDIKVLEYLAKNKSCGIDSIAAFINTPKQSYLYEVEPYLLQTGMVNRKGSGRTITQDGLNFLRNLVSKP